MIVLGTNGRRAADGRVVLLGLIHLLCFISARGLAGEEPHLDPVSARRGLFRRAVGPAQPESLTAAEIAQRIDHASESIRNDGLVVLKQPDVFGQARMTKYRREFEEIMAAQKGNFQVILAGRIARVDQASLDSQTSLSASLAPPGTSIKVTPPTVDSPPVAPALNGTFDAPRFVNAPVLGQGTLNLGLEPNQVLDEQKSYLDRLNSIRRVNLGDDLADSAGYGLYLIRMPLSITPGECTVHGHGAETTVTIKPEFPADFLPSTFRNLVVNDLVDQLGPPLYEAIRTKLDAAQEVEKLQAEQEKFRSVAARQLVEVVSSVPLLTRKFQFTFQNKPIPPPGFIPADDPAPLAPLAEPHANSPHRPRPKPFESMQVPPVPALPASTSPADDFADRIFGFLFRDHVSAVSQEVPTPAEANQVVVARLRLLLASADEVIRRWLRLDAVNRNAGLRAELVENLDDINELAAEVGRIARDQAGQAEVIKLSKEQRAIAAILLRLVLQDFAYVEPGTNSTKFPVYLSRLYSTALLDDVAVLNDAFARFDQKVSVDLSGRLAQTNIQLLRSLTKVGTLASRLKTLRLPSDRAAKRSYPIAPGELVDFFLESNLQVIADDIEQKRATKTVRASDVRSYLRQQLSVAYDILSRPSPKAAQPVAVLDDQQRLDDILGAIHSRSFAPVEGEAPPLLDLYRRLVNDLPNNLDGRSLGALCWAIAVDAALLDEAFREQAAITFRTNGLPCPDWASLRFYHVQPELLELPAQVFNDYVAARWPIVTFALDPVVDQQNILDSFSLRRDLQLALAFAFSTGRIGINQLTTYRRKIQQDEETIALNKTVTSFAHGNETFGWRISPRLQTPPSQGNLATLGSTLLRGGPRPNYNLQKSKIEPGQRDLAAVVIMPSFLPTVRVESTGNWFRLDDPEHLEVRTKRMLEQGRRIHELRQQVVNACDAARYRPADIRFLRTKIDQLDAMLPIQSRVVSLPFDNAAAGFDLFTEGATALVPELNGFEGAEAIIKGQPTQLVVFGKYISIHETRVVAGGRELPATGDTPGYEILSREVMTVRLPKDVQPSETQDGRTFVEVYLATPNGISNRLMIPYTDGECPKDEAKPPVDPDGTVVETYEATRKQFPPKVSKAATTAPAKADDPPVKTSDRFPDPINGVQTPKGFTPAVSESEPPPTPVPAADPKSARADRDGAAIPVAYRQPGPAPVATAAQPAVPAALAAAARELPKLPEVVGLPPLPAADPALARTAADLRAAADRLANPGAVVMPTPIVVMPPAARKATPRTALGRALDRLHHDKERPATPQR